MVTARRESSWRVFNIWLNALWWKGSRGSRRASCAVEHVATETKSSWLVPPLAVYRAQFFPPASNQHSLKQLNQFQLSTLWRSDPEEAGVHYVLLDAAVAALRWDSARGVRGRPLTPELARPAQKLVDYLVRNMLRRIITLCLDSNLSMLPVRCLP